MQASLPVGKHVIVLLRTPPPHCGHRKHLRTPQCRLPGVQDGPARLRRTPVTHCGHRHSALRSPGLPWIALDCGLSKSPIRLTRTIVDSTSLHCGHRRHLHTPQRGFAGVQEDPTSLRTPGGHRDSALQTTQVPTHSATRTRRQAGVARTHCGLGNPHRKRRYDSFWDQPLRVADNSTNGERACFVADSATPHCRQRRYLHTPQRGLHLSRREIVTGPYWKLHNSALRTPYLRNAALSATSPQRRNHDTSHTPPGQTCNAPR